MTRTAKDFEPEPYNGWCEECVCGSHDMCDGLRYAQYTIHDSDCRCPCNGKWTKAEKFALRKFVANLK